MSRGLRMSSGKHAAERAHDAEVSATYHRRMVRTPDLRRALRQLVDDDRLSATARRLRDVVDRGRRGSRRAAETARDAQRRRRTRRLPAEGVVRVEYSPELDGDADPGEIVWAWVPYQEDPSQGKDRPVVVIGRRGAKLVGVPLTTKRDDREAQVAIGTGAWDSQRRESYARLWRLLDLEPGSVRREGAVLAPERFERLIAAVGHYYDLRVAAAG